jgi:cobalamin synthase
MTIYVVSLLSFAFVVWFTARAYQNTDQGQGQSRRSAIIEAWANIVIGFTLNYIGNLLILPLAGFHIGAVDNFLIGWIYTAVSIVRQYAIRRWFNGRIHRLAQGLARG